MLILFIGIAMALGLMVAIYLGFKEQYSATEGTLAILVLETFFVSIALIIYGIISLIN